MRSFYVSLKVSESKRSLLLIKGLLLGLLFLKANHFTGCVIASIIDICIFKIYMTNFKLSIITACNESGDLQHLLSLVLQQVVCFKLK